MKHLFIFALGLMLLSKPGGGVWVLVPSQVVAWGTCNDCGFNGRTIVLTVGIAPIFTTDSVEEVSRKYKEAAQ